MTSGANLEKFYLHSFFFFFLNWEVWEIDMFVVFIEIIQKVYMTCPHSQDLLSR